MDYKTVKIDKSKWYKLKEIALQKEKTLQLIKDNSLLEKLAKSAWEKAGEFSTDRFCEKLDPIFNK